MSKRKVVGVVGLEDIVVVDTDDALLICRRGETQEVKQIVEYLQKKQKNDLL